MQTRISPSRIVPISSGSLSTRAGPSTSPADAAAPVRRVGVSPDSRPLGRRCGVTPQSITAIGSLTASGIAPSAGGGVQSSSLLSSSRRRATIGGQWSGPSGGPPVAHMRQSSSSAICASWRLSMEDVLAVRQIAVAREQRAELADLVVEAHEEPVVAVELVLLDVGEHGAREPEQLLEGLAAPRRRAGRRTRRPAGRARARSASVGRSTSCPCRGRRCARRSTRRGCSGRRTSCGSSGTGRRRWPC